MGRGGRSRCPRCPSLRGPATASGVATRPHWSPKRHPGRRRTRRQRRLCAGAPPDGGGGGGGLALPCVRGVDVVVLLVLMLLCLELVLVLLGAGCDVGVLFGEDAYDAGGDCGG
jgi:hypothetical protein